MRQAAPPDQDPGRSGQVEVLTRPGPDLPPVLATRIGLDGDVVVMVDRDFAAAPRPELLARHRQEVEARLAEMLRTPATLAAVLSALMGVGAAGSGAVVLLLGLPSAESLAEQVAWGLGGVAAAAAGGALLRRLRAALLRWFARRWLVRLLGSGG